MVLLLSMDDHSKRLVDNHSHLHHRPTNIDIVGTSMLLEDKRLEQEVAIVLAEVHMDIGHRGPQDKELTIELSSPIYKIYKSFEHQFKFTEIVRKAAIIALAFQ